MYDVFYAVRFMNGDRMLYGEYVREGSSVEDPILTGKIQTPTKESTAQYDFTFEKWDKEFSVITDVTYIRLDVRKQIELDIKTTSNDIVFNLAAVHRTPGHEDIEYFDYFDFYI